jgi:flagellar hook-associated protein FlgK
MADYPKTNPTDTKASGNVANAEIDQQAGGAGAQVKEIRRVSDAMNDAADAAIRQQQSGGSGHSKP